MRAFHIKHLPAPPFLRLRKLAGLVSDGQHVNIACRYTELAPDKHQAAASPRCGSFTRAPSWALRGASRRRPPPTTTGHGRWRTDGADALAVTSQREIYITHNVMSVFMCASVCLEEYPTLMRTSYVV